MDVYSVDSENENSNASSTSTESVPRKTRHSVSRFAKKSTAAPPAPEPKTIAVTRRQTAMANTIQAQKEKQKFLGNFNPETSVREKRKLNKKMQIQTKKQLGLVHDHKGIHIATGTDLCDCMEIGCPGCFYPCKKCFNTKCGLECRVNRKSRYESIEYHGYNFVMKNPLDK